MTFTLTIVGSPRTKKNSQRIARSKGRYFILPSLLHQRWLSSAVLQANVAMRQLKASGARFPITLPVQVIATVYRKKAIGDLDNFLAAIGDLLQRAGIVKNDRQIQSWDSSRLEKDASNPRVEIAVETL